MNEKRPMHSCETDYFLIKNEILYVWDGEAPKLWSCCGPINYCPLCGMNVQDVKENKINIENFR